LPHTDARLYEWICHNREEPLVSFQLRSWEN